jgi:hypothetical protein
MSDSFECFECKKVILLPGKHRKCPSCGSANGRVVTADQTAELLKAGHYHNAPATGGPSKMKRGE